MTAVLSRATHVGIVPETTPGTYVAPSAFLPGITFTPKPEIAQLRDESIRNNDSVLQGANPGPRKGGYDIEMSVYPIETGHLLRAIVGPDTVAAASTATTLSSPATVGNNTIACTVAGVTGGVILVADGVNPPEIRQLVSPTTVNLNWQYPHNNAATVTYLTKHTFQQGTTLLQPKSYSITDFDGVQVLGYSYARCSSLGLTIDASAMLKVKAAFETFFPQPQSTPTPSFTALPPLLGWQWAQYNAATLAPAGIVTRYEMADVNFLRSVDVIPGSDGTQDPRELFAGDASANGKFTGIYENTGSNTDVDWTAFRDKVQTVPINAFVASPFGTGCALLITATKPDFRTFSLDRGSKYAKANIEFDGVANATDVGQLTVTLWNTQATAY